MYRRTFDIIAKYVASQNKVDIVFDTEGSAYADMENNVLHLPQEIANENAHAALALLMHEAAHIKHSKNIPIKELCPMKSDFNILNAIEDIRIDKKNFGLLPNVRGFYEEMVKKHLDLTKDNGAEARRRLCAGILKAEGFNPKLTKEDSDFMKSSKLEDVMMRGTQEIEFKDWKKFKKTIDEVKKLLKIDPSKDVPNKETQIRVGNGPVGDDQGQPQPQAGTQKVKGKGKAASANPNAADQGNTDGVSQLTQPSATWGKGARMPGGSVFAMNPLAMDEQCVNQFKEILNVKEQKIIPEGSILDTDNLVAYYTGDIEGLFKEAKTIRKKKSKIMFLIDCSGSMDETLIDGQRRGSVVKACVDKLTKVLDEVQNLEGLNVDWAIGQFADRYYPLTKENWKSQYSPNGGTNFQNGFDGAMDDMLKDYTVEGKRIIVAFTDGDVNESDVDHVNERIRKHHSDVRSLVIGVGSCMTGKFVKELVGDNVIIAQENATEVLIETIKEML